MSSFSNPHHLYLFEMKNGKKKLAYGSTAEDAYESLNLRLTREEIEMVLRDCYKAVPQRELHLHVGELG